MKVPVFFSICTAALLAALTAVAAQTQDPKQVVDAVVAQVNDDIITLSTLRVAMKRRAEDLQQLGQTEPQATAEVTKNRDQLIASLINDTLLVQKGKELGLGEEVENEVNQQLERIRAQDKPPDKTRLEEIRVSLRTELMKEKVFEREVDAQLFFSPSLAEVRAYFDEHQNKFRRLESVTLSEIFLRTHGKDELPVRAKAEELVAQLRSGADFRKLAIANSEREEKGKRQAPITGGRVGNFQVPMLREDIAAAIKDLKVGAISEPIRTDDGYQVLRVDERTPSNNAAVFNANRVREAMTIERSQKAHDEYLKQLHDEAYIEIAKDYQGALAPRLN